MEKVCTYGTMDQDTMENGSKIKLTEVVSMNGLMVGSMMDNGKITICMVKAFTLGKMAENTMENTLMIGSMALEPILGKMVGNTSVTG